MENRLKLTNCNLFQTCSSKNISDVSTEPFFFPASHHHRQLIDLFSPKPHSLSNNKPPKKSIQTPNITHQTPTFSPDNYRRRLKKTYKREPLYRKPKKIEYISSTTENYYYDWRSSDEDDDIDEETTVLSSRSFPSESSGSFRKNRACRKYEKKSKRIGDDACVEMSECGKLVKDSVAVAKKSMNPHEDFRVSMVEMIVEKQMFRAEDLQDLFECFISLNSDEHHRVIFEVFTEILEALFSASD